jgi:hypothetical protein
MSIPIFFIPGVTMFMLEKAGLIPKARGPKLLLDISVIALALGFACPISVALVPSQGSIEANKLEPQFREITSSKGSVIEKFYYNKGL